MYKVVIGVLLRCCSRFPFDDCLMSICITILQLQLILILYGALFILAENRNKYRRAPINSMKALSYRTAFLIGMFQVLSLIQALHVQLPYLEVFCWGRPVLLLQSFPFFPSIPVMFWCQRIEVGEIWF